MIAGLEKTIGGWSELVATEMTNYDNWPLYSHAYILEHEVKDDAGEPMGSRFVLLTHETGLEVFIPVVAGAAGGFLATTIGGYVVQKVLDAAFGPFCAFIREHWTASIDPEGGYRIVRVEIRTEHKGVMTLPFSKFGPEQVACLMSKWDAIEHISEANETCFAGELVVPPRESWGEKDLRSRDG